MTLLSPLNILLPAFVAASSPAEDPEDRAQKRLDSVIEEVEIQRLLHGFRLGYLYLMNIDGPVEETDPESPSFAERYSVRSAHQFVIGYEVTWRMVGHDWLNVLLVGNALISGLEQSRIFPSGNMLVGFEFLEISQLGVGVNFTPTQEKPVHMVIAAGVTPRVGDFYTPLHVFFVPDVDGHHRVGATLGVNW